MLYARISCDHNPSGLVGRGPLNAEVMLVGVAPAREELRTRKVYSGQTGQLTEAVLDALGPKMDDCYVTNLLCWWNAKPTMDDVAGCASRLVKEIDTVKPKVIVALGALPIQFFTGLKGKQVRGSCIWSDDFNCWIICTWQPTVVLTVSPGLIADVCRDLMKINYIKDKPKTLGHVDYEVVHDPVQAQKILDSDWLQTAEFPSLDVECKWSVDHWTSDIRCLSISDGDLTYCFTEAALAGLVWPLDPHWTFHNAMFDTQIMRLDQNVELPICDDTMLMSYSLDERGGSDSEADGVDVAVGIHGLKRLAREYCGADFYEVDLKTAPDEIVWPYNAKDAAYTSRLAKYFYERQLSEVLRGFYERMILPEARVCRDEKAFGVYVDKRAVNRLAITWGEEWLRLDQELRDDAVAYGWPEPDFNFNSSQQVKRFCNNYLMLDVPNTQAPVLEQHADHPWIAKRIRAKRIDKQLGTYVTGVINHVVDSRVHPDPSIHATVSGRKSYHNPPVGTIPTGSQYIDPDEEPDEDDKALIEEFRQVRGLFGAPEGKVFIEADYSAAELWTAAFYSEDKVMLSDLLSGDFHSNAAETMFKCSRADYSPEHWSGMRRNSKYVTFGVLFWRGAGSLYKPKPGQGGNLGKLYSFKQIEEMVAAWHERYAGHTEWSDHTVAEAARTGEQINVAGRKRRWWAPGVYGGNFTNLAANWPIQSTSHDHLIAARLELDSLWREGKFPARMLFDGHDAIYFECDANLVSEAVPMIKQVMERPRWFDLGIPVEIKSGQSWATGKKVA